MDNRNETPSNMLYWGEIDNLNNLPFPAWSKDVFNNMEQDVIINSVKSVHFKAHFFNRDSNVTQNKKETDTLTVDDVIKRTVKLIKYKNDIKEIVEKGKQQRDMFNVDKQLRLLPKPKDPTTCRKEDKIQFYRHDSSDFMHGLYVQKPINITNESALTALRSSVSTVLAFIGFTETTIVPLQILTEIAENYIKKMTKLLHVNVEKEKLRGETGFSDALDRTCQEMGIGSIRNLTRYYKEDVLNIKTKRVNECKTELIAYEESIKKLREEKQQINESSSAETFDEDFVIPELHVTSISGQEMLTEPFEAGLQMLKTIERQQLRINSPSEGPSGMSTELTFVNINELEEIKPFKRKRK